MVLSYCNRPMTEPYMYQSLPDRLRRLAEDDPDREAFVFYNHFQERKAIFRKELYEQSEHLAMVFMSLGLKKGDVVSFCLNNSLEMIIANMAVVCAGGVPYFIATNRKDGSDIMETMAFIQCRMLIIDANEGDANWKILENIWPLGATESELVPSLQWIVYNGDGVDETMRRLSFTALRKRTVTDDLRLPEIQPEDTLVSFCTSGSTGKPKQVICTHYGLFNWTKQLDAVFNMTNKSRFFCERSLSGVFGYPRTYLTDGTTRVFMDSRGSLSRNHIHQICNIIDKEKCDFVFFPNYLIKNLKDNPQLADKFTSVSTIILGGERVHASDLFLKGKFGQHIVVEYGSTEAGDSLVFSSDNVEEYQDGIVGKPLAGIEIKIIDEKGDIVQTGVSGELCVRSVWRFTGYHKQDELFRSCVDPMNWFHTGDIAHIRKDGNIVIDGRIKEILSIQTYKIFPWSIEQTLKDCPGVKHVLAVGVPDECSLEVICVCVVPKPGAKLTIDAMKKFCDQAFLEKGTGYGITTKPTHCLIIDTIPMTSSGKINRTRASVNAKKMLNL